MKKAFFTGVFFLFSEVRGVGAYAPLFLYTGKHKGEWGIKKGILEWNTLGVMGELKGTLKNGDCQGSHLVIYIKFLDELRGTGGHYNKFWR